MMQIGDTVYALETIYMIKEGSTYTFNGIWNGFRSDSEGTFEIGVSSPTMDIKYIYARRFSRTKGGPPLTMRDFIKDPPIYKRRCIKIKD